MQGTVTWSKDGGKPQPLKLLTRLPEGARVQVSKGGSATLSFARGGGRWVLKPGVGTVEAGGVKGPATRNSTRPDAVAVLPREVNVDRMAGKVRGTVNFVSDAGFLEDRPVLAWRTSAREIAELELVVTRPKPSGAEDRVFKEVLPGTAREQALPALPPGCYHARIEVSLQQGARGRTAEMDFEVLDPAVAAEFTRLDAAADDVPSRAALMAWAWELGLFSKVTALAEAILRDRPGNPVVEDHRARVAAWRKES